MATKKENSTYKLPVIKSDMYTDKVDKDTRKYWREKEARRMNSPSKYDSIRPPTDPGLRVEDGIADVKAGSLKDIARSVALTPIKVPLETVLGGRSEGLGPIGEGAHQIAGAPGRFVKSVTETKDEINQAVKRYKGAKDYEASLDRELENQDRRETRSMNNMKKGGTVKGYASGGSVSASSRGDGIAQRGKTKGRMC